MTQRPRFPIALDRVAHGRTSGEVAPGDTPSAAAPATELSARLVPMERQGGVTSRRHRMVQRLAEAGTYDAAVLRAMGAVQRERFVDSGLSTQAYEDTALPIGHGQTISKPSIVARMLSLLGEGDNARRLGHLGKTLEIGTGCGYQAALLSLLAPTVISVERLRALHDQAREALAEVAEVRRTSLRLVLADGRVGHPPNAPYDSIIAAAVGDAIPQPWLDQLAVGGRLVTPLQEGDGQVLVIVDRTATGLRRTQQEAVRFVPLESGVVR